LNTSGERAIIGTELSRLRHAKKTQGKKEATTMWKKPKIVEIAVGMEINSYACAEV
jgi:coenzyme PQQ precursor peptide PqqA